MDKYPCQRAMFENVRIRGALDHQREEHLYRCKVIDKLYTYEISVIDSPAPEYLEKLVLCEMCENCPYK